MRDGAETGHLQENANGISREQSESKGFINMVEYTGADMILPSQLVMNCQRAPERKIWLESLAQLLERLVALWSLRLETPFDHGGTCSWICPVVRADGTQAVLKLAMPHVEGKHEIQGLRHWGGRSMVRLLEADDDSGAMLLERCLPGTTLRSEPEPEQDVIIAGVLRRVWESAMVKPSPVHFRPLSEMIDFWCEETMAQRHLWPDAGLVNEGMRVMKELARPAPTDVLLATDLHGGNVLRAQREPWLAIDPKPFVGDRSYDPVQHLINCESRLHRDPAGLVDRIAGLTEVDPERLRLWTFARAAADPRDDWTNTRWIDIARALSA
jgi:streptomycin 6-kinase